MKPWPTAVSLSLGLPRSTNTRALKPYADSFAKASVGEPPACDEYLSGVAQPAWVVPRNSRIALTFRIALFGRALSISAAPLPFDWKVFDHRTSLEACAVP